MGKKKWIKGCRLEHVNQVPECEDVSFIERNMEIDLDTS